MNISESFLWPVLAERFRSALPEALDHQGRAGVLLSGRWTAPSGWLPLTSPVDGRSLGQVGLVDAAGATHAVEASTERTREWMATSLAERVDTIRAGLALMRKHRDTLVGLVAWEIGKTPASAAADVDRCLDGLDWYLTHAAEMQGDREPLGVVANISSWNYPMSVLTHSAVVQALAGNGVIAKIPSLGGALTLNLAFGLMARAGVPFSLLAGAGRALSAPLVDHEQVRAVSFVGGREVGMRLAPRLRERGILYVLEMEGVNPYAIWNFSDWSTLQQQIQGSFEYGKQRCTAYTRWVVQRDLLDEFLSTYRAAAETIRVGHPLTAGDDGAYPTFGPLISDRKAAELQERVAEARAGGAEVLYEGGLESTADANDSQAYFTPLLLTNVPRDSSLYTREPFGPIDIVVPVDSPEELIREANVSAGALVGSVASNDVAEGEAIATQVKAYKTGVNKMRSRGDKDEKFGGAGQSWEGAFVGGEWLIHAFTKGEGELAGNWPAED